MPFFEISELQTIVELTKDRQKVLIADLHKMSATVPHTDWSDVSAAWSKAWNDACNILQKAGVMTEEREAALRTLTTGLADFAQPVPPRPEGIEVPAGEPETVGEDGLYCVLVGDYAVVYVPARTTPELWEVRRGGSAGFLVGSYHDRNIALDRARTLRDNVRT